MLSRTTSPRTARTMLILRAMVAAIAAAVVTFAQDRSGDFALIVFLAFLIVTLVVLVVEMVLRGFSAPRWRSRWPMRSGCCSWSRCRGSRGRGSTSRS